MTTDAAREGLLTLPVRWEAWGRGSRLFVGRSNECLGHVHHNSARCACQPEHWTAWTNDNPAIIQRLKFATHEGAQAALLAALMPDQAALASIGLHARVAELEGECERLRMALKTITQHGCMCSPEKDIDPEERECASCIADAALARQAGG